MAEEKQQQDGQKTLVAFVVGLLIGGMLVWAFSGPNADAPTNDSADVDTEEVSNTETENETDSTTQNETPEVEAPVELPTLEVGNGEVSVSDQPASPSVALNSATYPVSEGWIGVREYDNDNLGYILGVVRFSEAASLVPARITLQRTTLPGRKYAVVIYTEDGDNVFNLASDVQIDEVFGTFTAQ